MMSKIHSEPNNPKVRVRSSDELDIRKKEFLAICKILDNLKIRYFLHGGILLGAIRDKGFIPWDWDVEIAVFTNEISSKKELLVSKFSETEFKIINYEKDSSKFKIDILGKLPEEVTKYTIMSWNHDITKKIFWRKNLKIPDHFLLNLIEIDLFDKSHYVPYPPEDYLKHQYGDWKTPIQTSNKDVYLTNRYTGKNFLKEFVKKIIINIKMILK